MSMKVVNTVAELNAALATLKREGVGFVPTMGALHAGHRSLVERARRENDTVVVSVFVNPTQFNDKNDLKNYPRTPEADCAILEAAGADIVFMPTVEVIYPEPDTRQFDFGLVDKVMEGATRPGHFNGVAQVVSRLFALVNPARAYFGEKDFQQIAVIKAMVEQLAIDIEIVECAIVRGEDGLALSSRNELLTPEHRAAAPHIYATISQCAAKMETLSPVELTEWVVSTIDENPLLKTIYFEAVDARTMQRVDKWSDSERIQGCCAVQAGNIRLIDNIRIK
jgi:pantoate--beta-alanine ligase